MALEDEFGKLEADLGVVDGGRNGSYESNENQSHGLGKGIRFEVVRVESPRCLTPSALVQGLHVDYSTNKAPSVIATIGP